MKNLVLIFSVIFLVASCTTIEEQYTGEGIRVKPEKHKEYYDDSPYYSSYLPSYYSPVYWGGFSFGFPYFFWSPYSYYGFSNYYYGYYGGYYGGYYRGYPTYYRSRSGGSVITKKQFKKRTSSRVTSRRVQGNGGKITSRGRKRSTVTRSGSSTRSRGTSSRGGSKSTVKKKN
jgi:hypothetical protein